MEHLPHLTPAQVLGFGGVSDGGAGLVLSPRGRLQPRLEGGPTGDPVEPASDRSRRADRACLTGEDEERGLEGVLGVGVVAQYAAADIQDHRTMSAQEGMEGS